jgi:hypothetical protein
MQRRGNNASNNYAFFKLWFCREKVALLLGNYAREGEPKNRQRSFFLSFLVY